MEDIINLPITLETTYYKVFCTFTGTSHAYRDMYSPIISDRTASSFYIAWYVPKAEGQGTATGIDFLIIGS